MERADNLAAAPRSASPSSGTINPLDQGMLDMPTRSPAFERETACRRKWNTVCGEPRSFSYPCKPKEREPDREPASFKNATRNYRSITNPDSTVCRDGRRKPIIFDNSKEWDWSAIQRQMDSRVSVRHLLNVQHSFRASRDNNISESNGSVLSMSLVTTNPTPIKSTVRDSSIHHAEDSLACLQGREPCDPRSSISVERLTASNGSLQHQATKESGEQTKHDSSDFNQGSRAPEDANQGSLGHTGSGMQVQSHRQSHQNQRSSPIGCRPSRNSSQSSTAFELNDKAVKDSESSAVPVHTRNRTGDGPAKTSQPSSQSKADLGMMNPLLPGKTVLRLADLNRGRGCPSLVNSEAIEFPPTPTRRPGSQKSQAARILWQERTAHESDHTRALPSPRWSNSTLFLRA